METAGIVLKRQRDKKRISLKKASTDLLIKEDVLEAIENEQWQELPDPTFVKGFIKNYAEYLGLDPDHTLALYRRGFDETKYPRESHVPQQQKEAKITRTRIRKSMVFTAIAIFIGYLLIQYLSILSAPKLEVHEPQNDINTSVPIIEVSGKTETGSTVSINGTFTAVDQEGNFKQEYTLEEGQNIIEIIAAKRLSPKSKQTRTVRLIR